MLAQSARANWALPGGALSLDVPRVMAVVNVTPDSFSDGGRWMAAGQEGANASVVERQCLRWVDQGAHLLDIGGESTRPGADDVDAQAELARVLPVIRRLGANPVFEKVPLSIDTRRASVARACLEAGAKVVNDISGLSDPETAKVTADHGAGLVIGHLRGVPSSMQDDISFEDILVEVREELVASHERAVGAGVASEAIVLDPGIGFGKTARQSAALTASSRWITARTGRPVLIGVSRKSFLGGITGKGTADRVLASVVAGIVAVEHGACILRVHDVEQTIEALAVYGEITGAYREAARGRE